MTGDRFESHTDAIRTRISQLAEDLRTPGKDPVLIARAALVELSVALEELRVAGEQASADLDAAERSVAHDSEESVHYRGLFEHAPGAYLVTDPKGVVLEANRAACAMVGRDSSYLRGKPLAALVADDSKNLLEVIDRVSDANGAERTEMRLRTRGGEARPVTALVAPERSIEGASALGWFIDDLSTSRPFEELTPTEAEQRVSSVQFDAIVGAMSEAVIAVDEEQRIVLFNPSAEVLLERSASDVMDRPLAEFLPEIVAAGPRGWIEEFIGGPGGSRNVSESTLAIALPTGATVPVEATISTARVDHSSITAIIMRDRSEAERLNLELRRSRDFDQLVLNTVSALVLVVDREGHIQLFNRECERVSGYTSGEVLGRNFLDVLVPDDQLDTTRLAFDRLTESTGVTRSKSDWMTKDGQRRAIRWSTAPVSFDHDITHTVATGLDVTRQQELERELLNGQRREAVAQLAGGVAHDFNNMCAVIRGHLDLLTTGREWDEETTRRFRAIDVAVQRAIGLSSNLSSLNQRSTPRTELVHLNETTESLCAVLTELVDPAVTLEVRPGATGDLVLTSPDQIEQVLLNLVLNACDAIDGPGIVRVTTESTEPDGSGASEVKLVVSDDGSGMDQSTLDGAFDPFFTTKEMGTGLGLPTVRAIIEATGGRIDIDSEPGRGTQVIVWLPMADPATPPPTADGPASRPRILLVDDEPEARAVFADMLRIRGYEVITAPDAASARKATSTMEPAEVLITDVRMPHESGSELATSLWEAHPEMRALFVSAYREPDLPEAPEGSNVGFLQKPFTSDELIGAVERLTPAPRCPGPCPPRRSPPHAPRWVTQ